MSAESGRASSSLAPPVRRVPRTPIRVPIDDVPRGSLVGDDPHGHDSVDVSVHVSMHPPADEALFDASDVSIAMASCALRKS